MRGSVQHYRNQRVGTPTQPMAIEVLAHRALASGKAKEYLEARLKDAVLGPLAAAILEDS